MTDLPLYQPGGRVVKVKIRPGHKLQFPGLCVHCARPATDWLPLRKRVGRQTRFIDVPLCGDCAAEVRRTSGDEERLQKIGRLTMGGAALLVLILMLILLPAGLPFILRLVVALALALSAAAGVRLVFQRPLAQAARPEKQAILASAEVVHFSWRATTFRFGNEQFAQRFVDLNETLLMEI
jgi:hypothetical protein